MERPRIKVVFKTEAEQRAFARGVAWEQHHGEVFDIIMNKEGSKWAVTPGFEDDYDLPETVIPVEELPNY